VLPGICLHPSVFFVSFSLPPILFMLAPPCEFRALVSFTVDAASRFIVPGCRGVCVVLSCFLSSVGATFCCFIQVRPYILVCANHMSTSAYVVHPCCCSNN